MTAADDHPAVPTEDEADALEQQAPAVPEAAEDTETEDSARTPRDPLHPDGSEADRLDQDTDGGIPPEEDEYPRESDG